MARPLHLIVNPAAGGGRAGRLLPQLVEQLHRRGSELQTTFTRSLAHGVELASTAIDAGQVAVAVGGDGLVSALAAAVAKHTEPEATLGIVPAGRGNDFARWLGIGSLDRAVDVLCAGVHHLVDLGMVNERTFTSVASLGFDSRVLQTAERVRVVRGSLVYPYATLKALVGWKPARFFVELDDESFDFVGFSVVVANSGSYGGGMRIAPRARLDDGLFDVVTINAMSRPSFVVKATGVFRGTHLNAAQVHLRRSRTVRVTSDRDFPIYADGERAGALPGVMTMQAGVLRVLAPNVVSLERRGG